MEILKRYSGIIATLALIVALGVAIANRGSSPTPSSNPPALSGSTGIGEIDFQDYGNRNVRYGWGGCRIASATSTCSIRNTTGGTIQTGRIYVQTYGTATGTMRFNIGTSTASSVNQLTEPTTGLIVDTYTISTSTRPIVIDSTAGASRNQTAGAGTTTSTYLANQEYVWVGIYADAATCASGEGSTTLDPTRGHCPAATSTDRFSSNDVIDVYVEFYRPGTTR